MIMIKQEDWDSPQFYLACKQFVNGHGLETEDFYAMIRILFPHHNMYCLKSENETNFMLEDNDR